MKTILINVATAGNSVIITGTQNKKIHVLSYVLTSHQQNFVIWKSGSTPISGEMHMNGGGSLAVASGQIWPGGGLPLLATAPGDDLVLSLDQSHIIGGHLTYQEIGV